MPILEKYIKQPGDTQDYDIDFDDYLTFHSDTGTSHTAVAETGLTLASSQLLTANGVTNSRVKVWVSGGTDGTTYKVTVTLTTTGGRVKQVEISVRVKED